MQKQNVLKTIASSMILLEYHIGLAFLLAAVTFLFGPDALIEVAPTVIFFGFWISQVLSQTKKLEQKLVKICENDHQIKKLMKSEFQQSYFVEILVLDGVNYLIMAFKYSNQPYDFISLMITGILTALGYALSIKNNNYVPILGIVVASLVIGQSVYLVDGHKNLIVLLFASLISSIPVDVVYIIKKYWNKNNFSDTKMNNAEMFEMAYSLANEYMHTLELQYRRIKNEEPEDKTFVMRWWSDLQFFILSLSRFRTSVGIMNKISTVSNLIQPELRTFDNSIPKLRKLRNIGEHIDEYVINNQKRHDLSVSSRDLQVGSWDGTIYEWLGVRLNVDNAIHAAEELFRTLQNIKNDIVRNHRTL